MALFAKKKPPEPAAADEQKISLALTPDEIDLLRECMKRTEDYYRGLLLQKQLAQGVVRPLLAERLSGNDKGQAEYDR